MWKVEVKSPEVKTRTVQGRNGPIYFHEQEAWIFLCDKHGQPHPYPQKTIVNVDDPSKPYPPGVYQVAPESAFLNRYAQLEIRPVLRPIAAQPAQRAA